MALLAFLILFPIVVFVHELGHFWAARRNGVKVEAFAIGMGKVIWSRKDKLGTEWRLCLFPIGGYAQLKGQVDSARQIKVKNRKKLASDHFESKTRWQRFSIFAAGPAFNYAFGFLVFMGLFMTIGTPTTQLNVAGVVENSPAQIADIREGDIVVRVNGFDPENISREVREAPQVRLEVLREGETLEFILVPSEEDGRRRVGIKYSENVVGYERQGMLSAAWESGDRIWEITTRTLSFLGEMIVGRRSTSDLGGIITIAKVGENAMSRGAWRFIYIIAFISISLGFFNLLPIPILDGGHLFITTIEGIFDRELPSIVKDVLFFIGFALVVGLMLIANGNDIIRLFR
ncbi:MAG: M50 family metallopeptidase [Alphaproteobacteria bacterium]|nr:M50 family metallopeptidase [Alphaproteobacteria bacterium]